MEFNPEVIELLRVHHINRDEGLLFLLGIYHNLDVDRLVPEETLRGINLTKIVEKEYDSRQIVWNMPLFKGIEFSFAWVEDWIAGFGRMNTERKGSYRDAVDRMKAFFAKYPEYRKEDVYAARDLYFSVTQPKFCMKSHKFIFDGAGAMKKSTLLEYCEKVAHPGDPDTNVKGEILS
jgi:hypothetical protein